jgi:hypothetical protein
VSRRAAAEMRTTPKISGGRWLTAKWILFCHRLG